MRKLFLLVVIVMAAITASAQGRHLFRWWYQFVEKQ